MRQTKLGDISALEAIKDLLELGIADCLEVKIKVRIGDIGKVCESFIPRKNWEQLLPYIVTDIKDAQLDVDQCEEEFKDSSGYIDAEGISHDSFPEQAYIVYLLQENGMSMRWILQNCDALKHLYHALKIDLLRDAPDSKELAMLKEFENMQLAMSGTDDDEHIVFIEDEYPTELLDEIYAKLKE